MRTCYNPTGRSTEHHPADILVCSCYQWSWVIKPLTCIKWGAALDEASNCGFLAAPVETLWQSAIYMPSDRTPPHYLQLGGGGADSRRASLSRLIAKVSILFTHKLGKNNFGRIFTKLNSVCSWTFIMSISCDCYCTCNTAAAVAFRILVFIVNILS